MGQYGLLDCSWSRNLAHLTQLTALNTDIQLRALQTDLGNAIASVVAGTSNNSNGVGTLGMTADGGYNPVQMQQVPDKLDELINALQR